MISFNLRCSAGHEFEGWFRGSEAFETERRKRRITCPSCGDSKIEKALSAPNIATSEKRDAARSERAQEMRKALRAMREHVEKTSENVGPRFAEEARRIHYGEAETRSIYGQATREEATDLAEEGVEFAPLPWIEEAKDN